MTRPQVARVTMAQVAARAGVSVMTVSYAYGQPGRVSEASRARVLAAASDLGYAGPDPSARSLRSGSSGAVGVVLGEHLTYAFDDPQATAFMSGIAEVCAERGLGMTILPVTGGPGDTTRVRAAAVDAFVVWTVADDDPVVDAIIATQRPAVVHGGPGRAGLVVVSVDNRAAAKAVGLAAFAGARHPAVLSFPLTKERKAWTEPGIDPDQATFPVTRDRLLGFRDAAETLGIPWQDVTVAVCSTNDAGAAHDAAEQLLQMMHPVDAIAAMSDEMALGTLRAAAEAGVFIPDAVAVSGWDDGPRARPRDLTTVRQSMRSQGSTCARIALGEDVHDATDDWEVILRGTTRTV